MMDCELWKLLSHLLSARLQDNLSVCHLKMDHGSLRVRPPWPPGISSCYGAVRWATCLGWDWTRISRQHRPTTSLSLQNVLGVGDDSEMPPAEAVLYCGHMHLISKQLSCMKIV